MMAVALVGAGEAIANRLSTGETDVDEAAGLMIDLFWRGLKGAPAERDLRSNKGSNKGSNVAAG